MGVFYEKMLGFFLNFPEFKKIDLRIGVTREFWRERAISKTNEYHQKNEVSKVRVMKKFQKIYKNRIQNLHK